MNKIIYLLVTIIIILVLVYICTIDCTYHEDCIALPSNQGKQIELNLTIERKTVNDINHVRTHKFIEFSTQSIIGEIDSVYSFYYKFSTNDIFFYRPLNPYTFIYYSSKTDTIIYVNDIAKYKRIDPSFSYSTQVKHIKGSYPYVCNTLSEYDLSNYTTLFSLKKALPQISRHHHFDSIITFSHKHLIKIDLNKSPIKSRLQSFFNNKSIGIENNINLYNRIISAHREANIIFFQGTPGWGTNFVSYIPLEYTKNNIWSISNGDFMQKYYRTKTTHIQHLNELDKNNQQYLIRYNNQIITTSPDSYLVIFDKINNQILLGQQYMDNLFLPSFIIGE